MKNRILLFIIIALAIVSAAQLSTLLISTSPYTATKATLWSFFISAYLALTFWGGLVWYIVRQLVHRRSNSLLVALRQAALVSMIIVLSFFFNTLGIFTLWDVAPLAIAAILIEFFFQAEKKPHATLEYDTTI
jgi:hypothetical protein